MTSLSPFPTLGFIRRRVEQALGRPVEAHQIEYVIESRGIQPVGKAGHAKVYAPDAVDLIVTVLREIAERRATNTAIQELAGAKPTAA